MPQPRRCPSGTPLQSSATDTPLKANATSPQEVSADSLRTTGHQGPTVPVPTPIHTPRFKTQHVLSAMHRRTAHPCAAPMRCPQMIRRRQDQSRHDQSRHDSRHTCCRYTDIPITTPCMGTVRSTSLTDFKPAHNHIHITLWESVYFSVLFLYF